MALAENSKRADALTRLIADRVAELRKSAGMSQTDLGKRMAELRPTWSRSAVVKLENYNRESLSVTDLLALADALGVPPIWLLIDPWGRDLTPIVAGIDREAWPALLWLDGTEALAGRRFSREGEAASLALRGVRDVASLADRFSRTHSLHEVDLAIDPEQKVDHVRQDENERRILRALRDALANLLDRGYPPMPVLSPVVVERAKELGIDLPGVEG